MPSVLDKIPFRKKKETAPEGQDNGAYVASNPNVPALIEDDESGDENPERGNWTGKMDFLLSCLGYAVGLGNLWRFPYLCFKNGGGAFLFPYCIMLLVCGVPLFALECVWGQFSSCGPIPAWRVMPLLKGAGYCAVTISFFVTIYYNVIITWVLFYLFSSFTKILPWADCNHYWNTPECSQLNEVNGNWSEGVFSFSNGTSIDNDTYVSLTNKTLRTPSNEYFMERMLQITDGMDDMGTINWELALCLLLAWIIVYLCILKGIKTSGRVVYFTATFPYLVLTIILIRGATLEGSLDGVIYYTVPDFSKLTDYSVWGQAAVQIFYSLGPGWGGLLTFASYNRFHHNCLKDAVIVSIANSLTSVYAGFAIFCIIGFLSHHLGVPIDEVAASGPSLAFEAYPEAIARLPGAPFWSIIFFFMLITLGLDSQFGMMEGVISALVDEYPQYLRKWKIFFTLGLCIVCYFCGLIFITKGGIYMFTLIDNYVAGVGLLTVTFLECIAMMWVYGWDNFSRDAEMMMGHRPSIVWRILWQFVTPLAIIFVFFAYYLGWGEMEYAGYVYPPWAHSLGWMSCIFPVVFIPLVAVIQLVFYTEGTLMERLKSLVKPAHNWGPSLERFRALDSARYPPLTKDPKDPIDTPTDQYDLSTKRQETYI